MKNFNFWRSLFFAALAVVGFAACSDDDDNGGNNNGEASLTVNGKQSTTIGVKAAAGDTEAVEVVSSNPWTLAFETEQDWCVPSVTAAKGGTSSLKFTVTALPEGVEERSATAILSSNGEILGVPYTVKATIIIQQSPSGQAPVLIYKETFGTDKVGSNTDVDKYTKWNKTGEGAADVTYTGSKTSVRDSNPNNSDSYEGASGAPILFFGASPATFIVQNITLTPEQTNLQLTFGGQQTINYSAKDYTWSNANLLVALSADGTTWSTIQYTTNDGDQNRDGNNWVLATANFTLKAPTTKLFIRFLSPVLSSNLRIDDITLETGLGGQVVDLAAGDPIPTVTISEITAPGTYEVKDATVIANYATGFLMQDATGMMLVYSGNGVTPPAVGKIVTVKGTAAAYGGVFQFSDDSTVTETGQGTVPPVPAVTEITADNIAEFMTSPKVTYVKLTGTFVIDGSYRNLIFPFETSYKGSIQAPAADFPHDLPPFDGQLVDITGWFLNNAAGTTYLSVLMTDIEKNASVPVLAFTTQPEPFAGNDPQIQKIEFEATNIPADQLVTFEFTGDNADKFNVESQDATSVTIKAVGNNDSDEVYTATLTASYNGTTLAHVAVKQTNTTNTKGIFTSISGTLPTANNTTAGYYADNAKINDSEEAVSVLKLGTASKNGAFTTAALGITGSKKLSFYAAAWSGKTATLYVRVNKGGSVAPGSVALASNSGVSGSSPYTITFNDAIEYFTVELTDLTAESMITFSTNATFEGGKEDKNTGRALIAGIQIY